MPIATIPLRGNVPEGRYLIVSSSTDPKSPYGPKVVNAFQFQDGAVRAFMREMESMRSGNTLLPADNTVELIRNDGGVGHVLGRIVRAEGADAWKLTLDIEF